MDQFDLAKHILTERFFCLIDKNVTCWVAGGALRDLFSVGHISSDIDVFFPNKENYEKAKDILSKNKKVRAQYFNDLIANFYYKGTKIQLIGSFFFETPKDCIEHFDFTVTQAALDNAGNFFIGDRFFVDLASKRLVVARLDHPVGTLRRLQKYIKKGFSICDGGLLSICDAIRSMEESELESAFTLYPNGEKRIIRID